jgi:hypothetical protein
MADIVRCGISAGTHLKKPSTKETKLAKSIEIRGMVLDYTVDPNVPGNVALKVTAPVTIKMRKNDPSPRELEWTLDYSRVDLADILERASRTDVITLQARYRNKPFDTVEFDVSKDIGARPVGTPKDPKAEILKHAKGLSREELEQMFLKLLDEKDGK